MFKVIVVVKFDDGKDKIQLHVVSTRKPGLSVAG